MASLELPGQTALSEKVPVAKPIVELYCRRLELCPSAHTSESRFAAGSASSSTARNVC